MSRNSLPLYSEEDEYVIGEVETISVLSIISLVEAPPLHIFQLKSDTNTFHRLNQQVFGILVLSHNCPEMTFMQLPLLYQEMKNLIAQHPRKKKAKGRWCLCFYFSGNRTKKWNCFNPWCLILAGLPKQCNAQHENIHLICASNKVPVLQMAQPIVEELLLLQEGIEMYDAYNRIFLS